MRNLFLALVLANLAFAAWRSWFAPQEASMPRPIEPPLRLVGEIDTGQGLAAIGARAADAGESRVRTADAAGAESLPPVRAVGNATAVTALVVPPPTLPAVTDPGGEARCVSVGPFAELAEAVTASARLRRAGLQSTQRVGEGDLWAGYRVQIVGIPSREAANTALETLRRNGVVEAYLITDQQDGDTISLGVIDQAARLERLREQVSSLGLETEVVERTRRGNVYWVDVQVLGNVELDLDTLHTPERITRLEQRSCGAGPDTSG